MRPRHFLYGAALLVAIILTSCAPLPGEGWANYTVAGNYIYVSYQEYIFRVDTSVGNTPILEWVARAPNNAHMFASPAVAANGNVYVGTYNKELEAFSPYAVPREQNLISFDAPTANDKYNGAATVNDALGLVYIGHNDKGVFAYDLTTGAEKARFADTQFGIWATPILDPSGATLYVASLDHYVYALDAATLTLKWKSADLNGAIYGTPLLADGTLYVGTFDGQLHALNAETGETSLTLTTDGALWATPVLEDGILYFGDLKGTLYAVNASDLTVRNKVVDDQGNGAIRGSVALATDEQEQRIVLVGSENKSLRAYRASDLTYLWGQQTEDRIFGDLVVIGDDVVFTTMSNNQLLTGYNYKTHNRSWNIPKPTEDDLNRTAAIRVEFMTPTPAAEVATPEAEVTEEAATSEPTTEATAETTPAQ